MRIKSFTKWFHFGYTFYATGSINQCAQTHRKHKSKAGRPMSIDRTPKHVAAIHSWCVHSSELSSVKRQVCVCVCLCLPSMSGNSKRQASIFECCQGRTRDASSFVCKSTRYAVVVWLLLRCLNALLMSARAHKHTDANHLYPWSLKALTQSIVQKVWPNGEWWSKQLITRKKYIYMSCHIHHMFSIYCHIQECLYPSNDVSDQKSLTHFSSASLCTNIPAYISCQYIYSSDCYVYCKVTRNIGHNTYLYIPI